VQPELFCCLLVRLPETTHGLSFGIA
jgi:hypothetical protein